LFLILSIGSYADKNPLKGFSMDVMSLLKEWKVPGAAIGVIHNGKIVFSKGFGYRNIKKQLPVTIKTRFPIGSCSKAFTSMSVGMMVDSVKLKLDKPIIEYLPKKLGVSSFIITLILSVEF